MLILIVLLPAFRLTVSVAVPQTLYPPVPASVRFLIFTPFTYSPKFVQELKSLIYLIVIVLAPALLAFTVIVTVDSDESTPSLAVSLNT